MSMGEEGGITRIAGGLFGSDLTFALGKASSAPGQIPIADLRRAWSALPFK
jgi:3-dehydroquinate dehydratase-1